MTWTRMWTRTRTEHYWTLLNNIGTPRVPRKPVSFPKTRPDLRAFQNKPPPHGVQSSFQNKTPLHIDEAMRYRNSNSLLDHELDHETTIIINNVIINGGDPQPALNLVRVTKCSLFLNTPLIFIEPYGNILWTFSFGCIVKPQEHLWDVPWNFLTHFSLNVVEHCRNHVCYQRFIIPAKCDPDFKSLPRTFLDPKTVCWVTSGC